MSHPFRLFMTGLIDYAGLFPPAKLDMPAAVAAYARHAAGSEAWMLGRFIVTVGRLPELGEALESREPVSPWGCALLVGDRKDAGANLSVLPSQGLLMREFLERYPGAVGIETLECPLPLDACGGGAALDAYLDKLLAALVAAKLATATVSLELPAGGDDALVIAALSRARTRCARSTSPGPVPVPEAKLRCGGLVPEAFPSPQRVATVLALCARHEVPLKCTAGLHHPWRHRADDPEVMMHGFINVFGAGMLAHAGGLDQAALVACVSETDQGAFAFDADGFRWRDHRVVAADLAHLRREFLQGFGSCSFDEPITDLRTWDLL